MANKLFVVPMPTPIDVAITQPGRQGRPRSRPMCHGWSFFSIRNSSPNRRRASSRSRRSRTRARRSLTTPLATGALSTGRYRVSYYARITTPATTSSSLSITLGWTNDGQACTQDGRSRDGQHARQRALGLAGN
jgi:hypothetical protein